MFSSASVIFHFVNFADRGNHTDKIQQLQDEITFLQQKTEEKRTDVAREKIKQLESVDDVELLSKKYEDELKTKQDNLEKLKENVQMLDQKVKFVELQTDLKKKSIKQFQEYEWDLNHKIIAKDEELQTLEEQYQNQKKELRDIKRKLSKNEHAMQHLLHECSRLERENGFVKPSEARKRLKTRTRNSKSAQSENIAAHNEHKDHNPQKNYDTHDQKGINNKNPKLFVARLTADNIAKITNTSSNSHKPRSNNHNDLAEIEVDTNKNEIQEGSRVRVTLNESMANYTFWVEKQGTSRCVNLTDVQKIILQQGSVGIVTRREKHNDHGGWWVKIEGRYWGTFELYVPDGSLTLLSKAHDSRKKKKHKKEKEKEEKYQPQYAFHITPFSQWSSTSLVEQQGLLGANNSLKPTPNPSPAAPQNCNFSGSKTFFTSQKSLKRSNCSFETFFDCIFDFFGFLVFVISGFCVPYETEQSKS